MERAYLAATQWAADEVEEFVDTDKGKLNFPETSFANIVLSWSSGVRKVSSNVYTSRKAAYFEVTVELGEALTAFAYKDYQFFDACAEICGINANAGAPMPEGLRDFATTVLWGIRQRPTPPNRERKKDFLDHLFIYQTVEAVTEKFNLPQTRNDSSPDKQSACDVVSTALAVCGAKSSYTKIKDLMTHKSRERRRNEIKAAKKIWARSNKAGVLPFQVGVLNALSPEFAEQLETRKKLDDLTVRDILATLTST